MRSRGSDPRFVSIPSMNCESPRQSRAVRNENKHTLSSILSSALLVAAPSSSPKVLPRPQLVGRQQADAAGRAGAKRTLSSCGGFRASLLLHF